MVASVIVACKKGAWRTLSSETHVVILGDEVNGDGREELGRISDEVAIPVLSLQNLHVWSTIRRCNLAWLLLAMFVR